MQVLEHMPGERKVILTDPQTELLEQIYTDMKAHGGTLIVVDPDIGQDARLAAAISAIMRSAQTDHIQLGLYWSGEPLKMEEPYEV